MPRPRNRSRIRGLLHHGGSSVLHHRHLKRRGDVFSYRRKVHRDLVALLGGRTEITRSLRAGTVAEARRLADLLNARVWLLFEPPRVLQRLRYVSATAAV